MAFPSFLITGLFILLVLLGAADHGVLAQDSTSNTLFNSLLDAFDNLGYTNFTAVARQITDAQETALALALADTSTPKTLFVPNNDAFANVSVNLNGHIYDPTDNTFLAALLLYHLLPGSWPQDSTLITPNTNLPIPTSLTGHNITDLESNKPQVLVCTRGSDGSMDILNQAQAPSITLAGSSDYLIIYEIDAIIGPPPGYSSLTASLGLNGIEALRTIAGGPSLDTAQGYTLFAPVDTAFSSSSNITDAAKVWDNHVIMGQTVYSVNFSSETYLSASGFSYAFATTESGTQVSLNGITANIIRSDVLADNGVVHVIDGILWNTTLAALNVKAPLVSTATGDSTTPTTTADGEMNTSVGSTSIDLSSVVTPSATASHSAQAMDIPSSGSTLLSPGIIVGMVAIGLAVLSIPFIVFLTRRYRRPREDDSPIKVRRKRSGRMSVFEPPTPTPFRAWYGAPPPLDVESFPLKPSPHGSPVSLTAPPPARASREKAAVEFALRDNNNAPAPGILQPGSGMVSGLPPPGMALPMPMLAPEVMDHIVNQVSQRIARPPPPAFPPGIPGPPESGPPPSYRSRFSPPHSRSHLRRTMG